IGTTGGTESSTNDKSVTVRMILAEPQLGNLNGIVVGLNSNVIQAIKETGSQSLTVSGAKINVANLLQGQASGANLTTYDNKTVNWLNPYAFYQQVYNNIENV
ncbi:protein FilF, partial [Acinetobacter baumannii]